MKPYFKYKQRKARAQDQFLNVEVLSHHIPKTAGTSFYKSLVNAYGKSKVLGVYDRDLCISLIREEPIWVPSDKTVLHGHFPARELQNKQFPNAKRVVWLRDPIERAWSNLNHWLAFKSGDKYLPFKKKYIDGSKRTPEELFECLVNDSEFRDIIEVYKIAFKAIKPEAFDFIGRTENYNKDLERLGDLLGKRFTPENENTNNMARVLPFQKKEFYNAFESEYEFLRKWYDKDYGLDL